MESLELHIPESKPVMRFTIVDEGGTVSFVAPCHALKAIAASCERGAEDHRAVLAMLAEYDAELSQSLKNGLAVFDEHNTASDACAVHGQLAKAGSPEMPPFRVMDARTRDASLEPVRQGLVVFNIPARRIVQVQNSYANLQRQDRGRIRVGGKPTHQYYSYRLPDEWSIVP